MPFQETLLYLLWLILLLYERILALDLHPTPQENESCHKCVWFIFPLTQPLERGLGHSNNSSNSGKWITTIYSHITSGVCAHRSRLAVLPTNQNPQRWTDSEDSALPHTRKALGATMNSPIATGFPQCLESWNSIQTWSSNFSRTVSFCSAFSSSSEPWIKTHILNEQRHELSRCIQLPVNGAFINSQHTLFC